MIYRSSPSDSVVESYACPPNDFNSFCAFRNGNFGALEVIYVNFCELNLFGMDVDCVQQEMFAERL